MLIFSIIFLKGSPIGSLHVKLNFSLLALCLKVFRSTPLMGSSQDVMEEDKDHRDVYASSPGCLLMGSSEEE